MAEKRKLPPRRESSVKRRASEAPQPPRAKRKASTPAARTAVQPERVQRPLPSKIKDAEGLPTVLAPQPASLDTKDYQSISESGVLMASLERSKKKWLSDGILERYWTKPKKTKREQIEQRNPPKESMAKVGPCNIVVGPHIFDAMLYTVRDPNAPPSIQYAPPQRPMVHYGHPGNFQPYQQYPSPSQQPRPHPQSPAHSSPAQPPANQARHPKSSPARTPSQNGQRPSPSQQIPQGGQPPKPSPDPVIQMLATRAASDPELKALMRVVASSKATQEQLRAFQQHIDDLNAIIKAKEQRQQAQTPSSAQQTPQPEKPEKPAEQAQSQDKQQIDSKPSQTSRVEVRIPPSNRPLSQNSAPQSNGTPQIKQEPGTTNTSISIPSPAARPMPPPQQAPTQNGAPQIQSRPLQYGSPAPYYRPGPPQPPRLNYRSVVFEFTSPLTPYGSSTSGHAGSGDRYLFPEYSILEWLPGGNTIIASFLVIKKVDPNAPFPIEPPPDPLTSKPKGKGSKSKKAEKGKDQNTPQSTPFQQPLTPAEQKPTPTESGANGSDPPTPKPANLKEYYEPVTFRIFSPSPKILEPLTRVVRSPDEVRRYMNEVMNRAERAPSGFLALRLPREAEKAVDLEPDDRKSGTPAPAAGRTRLSRAHNVDEESEDETEGQGQGQQDEGDDEEEEELKDFYGSVTGLPRLAV